MPKTKEEPPVYQPFVIFQNVDLSEDSVDYEAIYDKDLETELKKRLGIEEVDDDMVQEFVEYCFLLDTCRRIEADLFGSDVLV